MKLKNLILSVPKLEPHRAPISVAIIAHAVELSGHPVTALDLNIKFYNYVGSDKYFEFEQVWESTRNLTLSEFKVIINFLNLYKDTFQEFDNIMISVFASHAHIFTRIICRYIKKHINSAKIILGGQGVLSGSVGQESSSFGDIMIQRGLADFYISGEGEVAVVEFLKQHYDYPGINSQNYKQVDELNELPFPNYKYFDLDEYPYLNDNKKEVFVVGSRGCVRKCTYCDVPRYWPKFRFRSGQNIAHELIFHYENYGVTDFYFTDSLVNGSLKSFRDMCDKLANYNQTHSANFNWKGQFIFRPKKHMPPEDFEMIKKAGGNSFFVGLETGSDKIRFEMDKKFTNEDVDYQLEHFSKNKIQVLFLMLMGYLTETIEDHNETLKMFPRWQKYVADGTIIGLDINASLYFLKGAPLEKMIDSHEVYFIDTNSGRVSTSFWESRLNPDLTIHERFRRRVEVQQQAIKYNWPTWRGAQRLQTVKSMVQEYKQFLEQSQNNKTVQVEKNGLKYIQLLNV